MSQAHFDKVLACIARARVEGGRVLTGGHALMLPGPEQGYEEQLNAIKGLIADDPGRVDQVVKKWINRDD